MSTVTGRWLGRDPIGEEGGINLFEFAINDSLGNVDGLGQQSLAQIGADVKGWIQSHVSARGGISHTFPELKFLVYAPPPVWLEANLTISGEVFNCINPDTKNRSLLGKWASELMDLWP